MRRLKIFTMLLVMGLALLFTNSSLEVQAASKKPSKVVISNVKSYSYNAVKITWKKAKNAKKYQVYRAASSKGSYKLIKTTTATSFVNKDLTTGKTYCYKVRALNGSKKGAFSAKKSGVPMLKKPTGLQVDNTYDSIAITWNYVNGATKYQVCRATSKDGEYEEVKTTKGNYYVHNPAIRGRTYYYKVRAYRVVNGKARYGAFSSVVSEQIPTLEQIQKSILSMVNTERAKVGLSPLELYDPINETSQVKAKDMYDTSNFSHYSENLGYFYDQFDEIGMQYTAGGENIAFGYSTVSSVMKGWMNSPGHKANILGEYTHLGVGYYKGYWVQQFVTNPNIGETVELPEFCDAICVDELLGEQSH